MTSRQIASVSTLERALHALEKLEAKLLAAEQAHMESLAVIGMACRFPGGVQSPRDLWEILRAGTDTITELPQDRWIDDGAVLSPAARWAGVIEQVDQFDANFFGLNSNEVAAMDPQHRLLLELAWEVFEDAAILPSQLQCSQTGVFVGMAARDYMSLLSSAGVEPNLDISTGNAAALAAGRIAYIFGLQGPTMCVDTACSSSLVALHLANQCLRRRECDFAIVGGANLLLSPKVSSALADFKLLSTRGRSRTFDADADGYVRSDGVGVVLLQRLSDAQRQGRTIRAIVRGSAINQNGFAASLTAPSLKAQTDVLRAALSNSNVAPDSVEYVEVHSNGSPMGDPIEIQALKEVLGKPRANGSACVLGSVKTFIGHAEAASGIASLIKAILVLENEIIPPNLHFKTLNPNISLDGSSFVIPTSEIMWTRRSRPRIAGVSATGLSGANAHVVLEEAPSVFAEEGASDSNPHVFVLSGKTRKALRDYATKMHMELVNRPELQLGDICYTFQCGRTHFEYRYATVVASKAELETRLAQYAHELSGAYVTGTIEALAARRRVAFFFSGMASKVHSILRSSDAELPQFHAALLRGDQTMNAVVGRHILPRLLEDVAHENMEPQDQELALFLLQYALVEQWRAWGVEPSASMGVGVGECVAAWATNTLSLEDAIRLASARARFAKDCSFGNAEFSKEFATLKFSTPLRPLMPSLDFGLPTSAFATANYWERQVRIARADRTSFDEFLSLGHAAILEIGPTTSISVADAGTAVSVVVPSLRDDVASYRTLLESVAHLHVLGIDIRFDRIDSRRAFRCVRLPTYPFQKERHWFVRPPPRIPVSDDNGGHRVLGHTVEPSADRPETRVWVIHLSDEKQQMIGVEEIAGQSLLSSGAIVTVACAAARELSSNADWELFLSLSNSPILPHEARSTLQVIAHSDGPRKATIRMFFRADERGAWTQISEGRIEPKRSLIDIDSPGVRVTGEHEAIPAAWWTQRLNQLGLVSDAFHIDQIMRTATEIVAHISFATAQAIEKFVGAAVIIASITHPANYGWSWKLELIEGLSIHNAIPTCGSAWLRLQWNSRGGSYGKASVQFINEVGEVLASARHVSLRAQNPAEALEQVRNHLDDAFVDWAWSKVSLSPRPAALHRSWIIVADAAGLGAALASHLRAIGDTVLLFPSADVNEHIDKFDLILAISGPFFGVVHLGALDLEPNEELSPETFEHALDGCVIATLLIVERLAAQPRIPRLWLVTRGAQSVGNEPRVNAEAGLWGLGRVLSIEQPSMWGGMIDLAPVSEPAEAAQIARVLGAFGADNHLALRNGNEFAARLSRVPVPALHGPLIRSDRTYVISGALTLLGVEAARWLVEQGAHSILMIDTRTAQEARASTPISDMWNATVRALEASSAVVSSYNVNTTNIDELREAFQRAPLPLGGVIHTGAANDYSTHRVASPNVSDAFVAIVRSKFREAWNLHTLATDATVDFFAMFTSLPSALGWEGLGADAAATSLLRAIARQRRDHGLPAAILHLAFPNGIKLDRVTSEQQLLSVGLQGMPFSRIFPVMLQLGASGEPAIIVGSANWELLAQNQGKRSLFENLIHSNRPKSGSAALSLRISSAEPTQAYHIVTDVVRRHVARVVQSDPEHLPANHENLQLFGVNSIQGVQVLSGIETSFGVSLRVSVFMGEFTIDALARRVLAELRPKDSRSARISDPVDMQTHDDVLVELCRKGTRTPFFFAPPLTGAGRAFQSVAHNLHGNRPFYSFNAPGVESDAQPFDRVEPIARTFLDAMRRAQPHGPYRFGGYSFGALVAYEMAQLLRKSGERIDLLILGDLPALWRPDSAMSPLLQMAKIFNLPIEEQSFLSASPDQQIAMTAAAVGRRLMLPPEIGESSRQLRMYRAHLNAMQTYHVEPYDGPVTLLRAADTHRDISDIGIPASDFAFGWQTFCTQKIAVRDVPGNHLTAIFVPSAVGFAKILDDVLDQADAQSMSALNRAT